MGGAQFKLILKAGGLPRQVYKNVSHHIISWLHTVRSKIEHMNETQF